MTLELISLTPLVGFPKVNPLAVKLLNNRLCIYNNPVESTYNIQYSNEEMSGNEMVSKIQTIWQLDLSGIQIPAASLISLSTLISFKIIPLNSKNFKKT